ncbi:efflux RND transporter permease subunit [Methylomicrobium sp. Wu6]|uniref:efflux RND transporter permease subunit n=1 Tax=Methylomicrobium sp. Wu6 TaxID=3107928 RepID=UPI002DD66074|nr:efflux RND transporter permease subunit [Methylomicrobium sp. Wu6]MEC4748528.1 efflux RND transporter permease subunit [Methylomicrobium sp. Wu6]
MTRPRGSRSLLGWFAGNPVAANLLMLLIFIGGIHTLQQTDREAYPRFAPERIGVTAPYPGAGPAEIQQSVCIPIEEAIHDLQGIKKLNSTATGDKCEVSVQVLQDYPLRELSGAIRSRVQAIKNLPKEVERIDIEDSGWEYAAISVILSGDADKLTLRRLAETVRDDLAQLGEVRKAELWNQVEFEVAVEIPAERLKQQQLTLDDVAAAVRRESLDLAGGVMKAPTGEFQLRAKSTADTRDKLLALTLRTYPDGTRLTLGDIATVTDGYAEKGFEYYSDGKPSETIGVIARHNLVGAAEQVARYVETLRPTLPEGIQIRTRRDNARSFSELLDTLMFEGVSGFLLVLLVLWLFLSTQVAVWAAVGVMISVFGALWWMPACGVTLNMLSLFGFVLSMGVLVDDAIIVSERIHELQCRGVGALQAAIKGVRDVAVPVTLGVLIGLIAFLPGLFVPPSWATKFMKPVAVVMILSLAFSLVEALLILPAHLAHEPKQAKAWPRIVRLRVALNGGLAFCNERGFQPFLRRVLAWRYATVALFAGAVIVGLTLVKHDYVKLSLEEDVSYDNFHIHLRPPLGTPYAETRARIEQFVAALKKAEQELNQTQPPGSPSVVEGLDVFIEETDPTIWVEFSSEARKNFHIRDLIKRWYDHVGDVGDFRPDFHTPTEQDVIDLELEVTGPDPVSLGAAVDELKNKIAAFPGVTEIEDSRRPGKPELRLELTASAERLGLRLRELAEQVRHAYFGDEAQRFIRGRDQIKIMIRTPRAERQDFQSLRALSVALPDGGQAPLGELAKIGFAPGFGELTREDRRGIVSIQARLDKRQAITGEQIFKELQADAFETLENRYPGLEISGGAAKEEADRVTEGLKRNTLISLVAIYALIAVSFRSYSQPLLFMLAVPVAWLGALLIHWALGMTMTFQSVIGAVAASGVVVNDSIVLLDYIRQRRADTSSLSALIVDACASRFRPIVLVALTNLAGFFPMLFETSEQAVFLVPMTLSLTFGLLFGMAATLILIPACYAVLQDFDNGVQWLLRWLRRDSSNELLNQFNSRPEK